MEITEFKISDYQEAIAFWENIEGITLNESDTLEAISQFLGRNTGLSFTAKENGIIIGTILCGHNGRAAHIYHLAVAEKFRGQGIGKALLARCFSQLSKINIPRCNIFVYTNNSEGNGFWLKAGWNDPSNWKVLQKIV